MNTNRRAKSTNTVGILGGGQLAMMMAQAATKIGIKTIVLDASADACAGSSTELITAEFHDPVALQTLAKQCDVITIDFENVPTATLDAFSNDLPCYPQAGFLTKVQDRWLEKTMLRDSGIPTADFFEINSRPDLLASIEATGYPAVLKTRRFGYDGKGQMVLRQAEDLEHAWRRFEGHALILEAFVKYDRECSIIGVRNRAGEIKYYPITDNHHEEGILRESRAPSIQADAALTKTAQKYLKRLLDDSEYVGVLTLELFVVGDQLLANEIAPRVHNSGHWTIEGTNCSQFENHIRAVADMPLGDTEATSAALMVNCIGQMPLAETLEGIEGLTIHDYGKQSRAGRKVGHLTIVADEAASLPENIL